VKPIWLCLLLCAAGMLTGCVTADAVYLKDANGRTAQCGPYTKLGNIPMEDEATEMKMRSCISKLELQGYDRIDAPKAQSEGG
jgi:hypothetical protein